MNDSDQNGFLAGLLDFADLPDSDTPPPPTSLPTDKDNDKIFRCGFCLGVKYKNQSSIDSHIKDCAIWKNYTAKFWREAGWTRASMLNGFTFKDGHPVVIPDRICQYCKKVFANPKEVTKHISAARCINAQAIHDASPAVLSGQWKCGHCSRMTCYTSEVSLDTHIKLCAPRNGYEAKYWREAGPLWEPGNRFGRGLDFKDGKATVKPERICQACYQCCKTLLGLTRHLENGQCPGEPDEITWNPPPPPSEEVITHLARNGLVMPFYNPSTKPLRTVEFQPPKKDPARPQPVPATASRRNDDVRPRNTTSIPSATKIATVPMRHEMRAPSTLKPANTDESSSEINFLMEVINTGPSPAITQLLVDLARADPECRTVPEAPLRPRQDRSHDFDSAPALSSRVEMQREGG